MIMKTLNKFLILSLFLFISGTAAIQAQTGYLQPSQALIDLVDGERTPSVSLSPNRDVMLLTDSPGFPSIEEVAQPELRLAGTRINPNTNGSSRSSYSVAFTLRNMATGNDRPVAGLPANPKISNVSWAPDGKHFVFLHTTPNAIELWVTNVEQARARKLVSGVNATYGGSFGWVRDSDALLVQMVPENRGAAPQRSLIPTGPVIEENIGRARPARTYQDLLQDSHDEALFDYYFTSQLTEVKLNGQTKKIGQPAIYRTASLSPDGRYILTNTIQRPYSYRLPASRFANKTQIIDRNGALVHHFADAPLADNVPIAFSATTEGPRSLSWRNDAPATLSWVEALDGGDPTVDVPKRDRVLMHAAPFRGEPKVLFETEYRYAGLQWSDEGFALVSEFWRDSRHRRTWKINPDANNITAELVFDLSTEDRYADPGSPEMRRSEYGTWVLNVTDNGNSLLLSGIGATPEGNRPFLSKYDMRTQTSTELWRSQAPYYETITTLLDDEGKQLITRRESVNEPPNYFIRNLETDEMRQLTHFDHPTPELRDVHKEFIQYQRADGVQLSATIYLPPGYDKDRDGMLPSLIWAYPREFRSADAAGQVADSPYRFARISHWGPHFMLTEGFVVVENATMPIVGEGDEEPNDTFVEQLVLSAQAIVDELERRGIGDPDRASIGGHSYGAFMTANLLAHSRIFRAGIARSGAYNRTLTPFGFQAEPRDFWDASDIYINMSPFMHADKIKDPILFIHGMDDNNSGTFPMQSERMYAAVAGKGGTARLVMLPAESHGYASRESLLHMLYEQSTWLNTYVKNAEPRFIRQEAAPEGD
jgi:dipeptidyl aminopeptidase/acylaminoacyl peptidase